MKPETLGSEATAYLHPVGEFVSRPLPSLSSCRKAAIGKLEVALGDVVQLGASEEEEEEEDLAGEISMGLVQAMWQSSSGMDQGLLAASFRWTCSRYNAAQSATWCA